jgi:hypothetical protein
MSNELNKNNEVNEEFDVDVYTLVDDEGVETDFEFRLYRA